MNICTESDIIGQVPAIVVGIGIENDVIRVPGPVRASIVVILRDAEEEISEPEVIARATAKPINVGTASGARKAPVLPRMIEMVVRIIPTGAVANPRASAWVNVRRFWVVRLIAERWMLIALRRLLFMRRRCSFPHGRRAMGRNISVTDLLRSSLRRSLLWRALLRMRSLLSWFLLRSKTGHRT